MASTVELIQELLVSTAHSVTASPDAWMSFLRTAAWHYKYSFSDQRIIHSYKPTATACATYDEWNNLLHRQIKSGVSGIPLLVNDQSGQGFLQIRPVYDVSDTFSLSGEPFSLMRHEQKHESALASILNGRDTADDGRSFSDVVLQLANRVTVNSFRRHYDILKADDPKGFSDFDSRILKCMTISAYYMVCIRCELDNIPQISDADLLGLKDLHSIEAIEALGKGIENTTRTIIRTYLTQKNRSSVKRKKKV
jgi:hypothetical protein